MRHVFPWSGALIAVAVLAGCASAQPNTAVPTAAVQTPPTTVAVLPTLAVAAPTAASATQAPAAPTAAAVPTAVAVPATAAAPTAASATQAPATAATQAPAAGGQPYADRSDAVALLASFYNAINMKDYARAYSYWQNPPQTAEAFAQGYANTATVQLIVRPPDFYDAGAGNVYTRIPALVIATQTDGSTQLFNGCYAMHRANIGADAGPQGNAWEINQATIAATPANADAVALLSQPCDPSNTQTSAFDNRDSAAAVLASYYNAIDLKDYARAYGYLKNPTQTAEAFAQGYANTAKATLLIRPSETYSAGAGNVYTSVPALVVATQTDGSTHLFAGCYTLHRSNLGADAGPQGNAWDIQPSQFAQAPATTNAIALLPQACAP